jgi:hypothetical protein
MLLEMGILTITLTYQVMQPTASSGRLTRRRLQTPRLPNICANSRPVACLFADPTELCRSPPLPFPFCGSVCAATRIIPRTASLNPILAKSRKGYARLNPYACKQHNTIAVTKVPTTFAGQAAAVLPQWKVRKVPTQQQ